MTLLIRPVKMNKSIYVRVPNDIAHIIGLDNQVEVSFSFEDNDNQLRLIYSLSKSKVAQHTNDPMVDPHTTLVAAPPIQALRTQREGSGNAVKVESEGLPER